jgi:hypothetical protein
VAGVVEAMIRTITMAIASMAAMMATISSMEYSPFSQMN